jgi:transposase
MKLDGNARTCLHSRLLLVRRVVHEGWTLAQAAEAAGVGVRTVSKWLVATVRRARRRCSIARRRRIRCHREPTSGGSPRSWRYAACR